MRGGADTHYYESTGFTPYYFAHVLYNVVRTPSAFARRLEDILGDAASESLCRPFPRFSNLHILIEDVLEDLFFEHEGADSVAFEFLTHIGRTDLVPDPDDSDTLREAMNDRRVAKAFDGLVDEVFHILFRDVAFLQTFNEMISGYIERHGEYVGEGATFTRHGRLRRVDVPQFVKDAVFHRDQGECRSCKKAIDRILSPFDRERFDHIHPLARHGANDVTNIQLLCQACNSEKSGDALVVSPIYSRVYPKD